MAKVISIDPTFLQWLGFHRDLPYGKTEEAIEREVSAFSERLWREAGVTIPDFNPTARRWHRAGFILFGISLVLFSAFLLLAAFGAFITSQGQSLSPRTNAILGGAGAALLAFAAIFFALFRVLIARGTRLQRESEPLNFSRMVVSKRGPISGGALRALSWSMKPTHFIGIAAAAIVLVIVLGALSVAVKIVASPVVGNVTIPIPGAFLIILLLMLWYYVVLLNAIFGRFLERRIQRRGSQLLQPTADELRFEDSRSPVVFLRSFRDDGLEVKDDTGPRRGWLLRYFWTPRARLEEAIAERLACFGPVIAIGKPGENLPSLGAARNYYSDADWQDRVSTWLQDCRMIVAVAGLTPGLHWELDAIAKKGYAHKLVIVMPDTDRIRRWDILRAEFALFPTLAALPETVPVNMLCAHWSTSELAQITATGHRFSDYRRAINYAIYGLFLAGGI